MNITREYIEQLSNIEPHGFETDREEQWFNIGLQYGLEAADTQPKSPWICVKDKLPCNEKDLIVEVFKGVELRTKKVGVLSEDGYIDINYMYSLPPHGWHWNTNDTVTHWFPLPERPKNSR